jgi:hypothetical protein
LPSGTAAESEVQTLVEGVLNGTTKREELRALEGRFYSLKVNFPAWKKADPKSDRWPIPPFAVGDLTTTRWSQMGWLD